MKKKKRENKPTDIFGTKTIIRIVEFKMFPRIPWNEKITYLRDCQPETKRKNGKKRRVLRLMLPRFG